MNKRLGYGRRRASARGFTMIEVLAALAVTALMVAGMTAMVNSTLDDTRAQQAALYQQQLGVAAKQLIQQNYGAMAAVATAATPVVVPLTGSPYQLSTFLPGNVGNTNPYGQTPCLLVYGAANGALQGLLVTEGGTTIADPELGYIAANSGQGGGSIQATNNAAGAAKGAFGAWSAASPNPAGASCSGTKTGTGHLASEVFFNGSQAQNADFLYRVAVPGNPGANTMQVPIVLAVQADYAACTSTGSIAADATGSVLNCENGMWEPQASFHWRAPVTDEAGLAALTNPRQGDVAMTAKTNRAYTYNGTTWQALAVNEAGNLDLGNTQVIGNACTPSSATTTPITTDSKGRVLSCTNGTWQSQSEINPVSVPMDSACAIEVGQPGTTDFPCLVSPLAAPVFDPSRGYFESVVTRNVPALPRNGNIVVYAWAHMTDSFVTSCPGAPQDLSAGGGAYEVLFAELVDMDSGATIASAVNQSSAIRGDLANINLTLAHEIPLNNSGYEVRFTTFWIIFNPTVNSASFQTSFCDGGTMVPSTGVVTSWTITPFY